ncbi:uncharacterized protein LOC114532637 [Dendronephthya gigantea]|uniref:uncharacterized protein LOC114532637 n=1 Tax=Dendronephthya gigantea TaxID=151771 RepID=UPI00106A6A10|nr:uncharacterized protein LOC114532637 [Dendronephthya gigantea]
MAVINYGAVIFLSTLSVAFVANVLVIIAHVLDPLLVFRNGSSMFVLNITIVDTIISLLWFIFFSLLQTHDLGILTSDYFIIATEISGTIFTMSTTAYFSLVLELYISISRPLWHRANVTRKVCRNWIISSWIVHLIVFEVQTRFGAKEYHELFTTCFLASFFFAIQSLNLATFLSLKTQSRALRERRDISESTLRAWKLRQENEKRFLVTIAILSIILSVTTFPYFIIIFFLLRSGGTGTVDHPWIEFSVHLMIIMNITINPFFYLWRLPKYKKTFKKLYCQC